jgi:catechol 2,3-dioxygenase-like lactoylglutathione lyase family enzyme
MSEITGVHHIAVRALDFDKSIAFYTNTLGLTLKNQWMREVGRGALVEITQQSYIEIFEEPPASFDGTPVILHLALRTDNVRDLTERIRAAGFAVTVEPFDVTLDTSIGPMALTLSFVKGPDGEDIELMTSDIV